MKYCKLVPGILLTCVSIYSAAEAGMSAQNGLIVRRACVHEGADDLCVVFREDGGASWKDSIVIASQEGVLVSSMHVVSQVGSITFQSSDKVIFYSTLSVSETGHPGGVLFRWEYSGSNKPEEIAAFPDDGILGIMYQLKTDSVWVSLASGSLVRVPLAPKNTPVIKYTCPDSLGLTPICDMGEDSILVHEVASVVVYSKWKIWPWPVEVSTRHSFVMLNTTTNKYEIQKRFAETTRGTNVSYAWLDKKGNSVVILDGLARTIISYDIATQEKRSPEYNISYQTAEGKDVIKEIDGWLASPDTWSGICVLFGVDTNDKRKNYLVDMRTGFTVQELKADIGTPIIITNDGNHIVSYTPSKEKGLFHLISIDDMGK